MRSFAGMFFGGAFDALGEEDWFSAQDGTAAAATGTRKAQPPPDY